MLQLFLCGAFIFYFLFFFTFCCILCYYLGMDITQIIKSQGFFQDIERKWKDGTLKNSLLFFCEDELTSKNVLILTSLLMEFPTFDLMNDKSAEFVKIASGADLDVKVFPKDGEKLKVADSAEIVSEAYVKPVNLPYKIFVINNFDISTPEAQNKLLKVIEEPPKNVYFIISATSEEKVLPTIKSRCDKVTIGPLSKEEIKKVCDDALPCILGKGYIGKTQELARKEDLQEVAAVGVSLACEMKNSKQVVKFSKILLDDVASLPIVLQVLSTALEDIMKIKCESENLCKLVSLFPQIKDVEAEYSVQAVCEICRLISHLREKIEFNANMTVAIDNFLLKMLEVKYLCK